MKILDSINPELIEILEPYIEWFFQQDYESLPTHQRGKDKDHNLYSASSYDYLKEVMSNENHIGPPEVSRVRDLQLGPEVPKIHKEKSAVINDALVKFLGAKFTAVHVFYLPGDYMGWHNNWDCPGYNILINYNPMGKGWFKYYDYDKDEIVTLHDPKGWSAKVGYYGGKDEDPSQHYWHCAGSESPRHTFGMVIPNKDMWKMMVEDIEG